MWLLLACAPPPADDADALRALRRASLDTRGAPPSEAEIALVLQDPEALDPMIDAFLQDPRFGDRVVDLFDELLRTRSENYVMDADLYGLPDQDTLVRSVGGELPEMVRRIAEEDLPWTELVTADWTMADEHLAAMWPLEREPGEGFTVARYTDGRPTAGMLSATSFYWRFDSTPSNSNRKRANALTTLLLCSDFISQPVRFSDDLDVTDPDAFLNALRTDPGCVSCHAALDPIASGLFGFFFHFAQSPADGGVFHPERERLWVQYTGVAPGFYGRPVRDLAALGRAFAEDPRYPTCLASHVRYGLLREDPSPADLEGLTRTREDLLAGGVTVRAAWASVLRDPVYQDPAAHGFAPVKMATPRLLADAVEALTGYRWRSAGEDVFLSDEHGLRSLAGDFDGMEGTRRARSPSPTVVLVQERLAEAGARWAVEQGEGALLAGMDTSAAPDEATIDTLVLRALTRHPEPDEVEALLALWGGVDNLRGDPEEAWVALVTALLRHPEVLLY